MKKYAALALALLMLALSLCACAKKTTEAPAPAPVEEPAPVAETPEPTEDPEPPMIVMQEITPPEPVVPQNVVHKNTDEEITAIAKEYCDDYYENGFDIERFRDDMMYIQPASSDDLFKIYDKNLGYLHTAPYNICIKDLGNVNSQFATSKQLAEEIGEAAVEALSDRALWYMDYTVSNYPKQMKASTLKKQYLECGLAEEKAQQLAEERVAFYEANPYFCECMLWGDAAATYRATDGTYRTRIEYNIVMREASSEYIISTGFNKEDVGRWLCCPTEVIMYPDEEGNPLEYKILFLGDMQYATKSESKALEKDLAA